MEKVSTGEVVDVLNVVTCINSSSDIETIAFLQANHGDILPAVMICNVPGTATKAPNIHTVDINCQENVDVTRVVYSKGTITAMYWSRPVR